MADRTRIEWTDASWAVVTGCDKVSPGCSRCYALTLAKRLKAMGQPHYQRDGRPLTSGPGFGVACHEDFLGLPFRWRPVRTATGVRSKRIFISSMGDLFHDEVPFEFVDQVFDVMARTPQHIYQVLTKRPRRMAEYLETAGVTDGRQYPNVWLGTSAESQYWFDRRIGWLLRCPATVRFLSCEPLLSPINLDLLTLRVEGAELYTRAEYIHWVIAGGESGPRHRRFDPDWARSLRDQCVAAGVPYFFKQHGGGSPKAGGRELDGRTWDEFPSQ